MKIVVYGQPAPQGSKRFIGHSKEGRGILIEDSKKVKPWREAVKTAALEARAGAAAMDGPLIVVMVFSFHRTAGHYRTGRNSHLLRDGAPPAPMGNPDLSKLIRSTEDALTDAGVWANDNRVVEFSRVAKVFVKEDPLALDAPGAVIFVERKVFG